MLVFVEEVSSPIRTRTPGCGIIEVIVSTVIRASEMGAPSKSTTLQLIVRVVRKVESHQPG
jgi:hypothetical protein